MSDKIRDNPALSRFEMDTPAGVAFARYRKQGDILIIPHTEVPPAIEGQGYGSRLVRAVLEHVRAQGLRVIPACPFVRAYVRRHPEFSDLVVA